MHNRKIFKQEMLESMPEIYSQDSKGELATVHLVARLEDTLYVWLLTEYSKDKELFYGYCCLNDIEMAELGYVSLDDLQEFANCYHLIVEKVSIPLKDAKKKYLDVS